MYQKSGKRAFDIILAVAGIFFLLPLFVLITFALAAHVRGNPFFIQLRPGLHGKLFMLVKLKTLRKDGAPISAFTKLLRSTWLDELPQLWNVLRGEMSVVGPRPLLAEYLPLYNADQFRRHEVLPGITGLAQVSGGNLLSWEDKFAFDLQYVEQCSFSLDLHILLKTISILLDRKRKPGQSVSVEPFKGNKPC